MASKTVADAAAAVGGESSSLIVAFLNTRSGGGMGNKVLEALKPQLGENVFDLGENPHPETILAQPRLLKAASTAGGVRIIVCGGDGTMTWIMSAVEDVLEGQLDRSKFRFFTAMMPLGTGNDLSRTFGWGGKFRGACLKKSWIDAVQRAKPAQLDRWMVSVMPSAAEQQKVQYSEIPEVFSVHEYTNSNLGSQHQVARRGRHHTSLATQHSQQLLEALASPPSSPSSPKDTIRVSERILPMTEIAEGEELDDSVASKDVLLADEEQDEEQPAPSSEAALVREIMRHVPPSRSVLKLADTPWRSYDGIFSNYFSVGVDAAGAHAFHVERRRNPKRFSSRLKNQLLYAWLGTCATGGVCGCEPAPTKIAKIASLHCRGVERSGKDALNDKDGEKWVQVKLPKSARGMIVLNLKSYAGGRNLWGPDGCCTPSVIAVDDGILEVVTTDSIFDFAGKLMTTNGLGDHAKRLIRCRELRIKMQEGAYMQMDGEPWLQPPSTVHLKCIGQSTVLTHKC